MDESEALSNKDEQNRPDFQPERNPAATNEYDNKQMENPDQDETVEKEPRGRRRQSDRSNNQSERKNNELPKMELDAGPSTPNEFLEDSSTLRNDKSESGDEAHGLERRSSNEGVSPTKVLGRRRWGSASQSFPRKDSETSDDTDDLETPKLQEMLKKRRASRQAIGMSESIPSELNSGLKALRWAVQEHELPMRLAYEQLDELAASADRVKSAIEKNRTLLTLQVKKSNLRYMRSAFTGWKLDNARKRKEKLKMKQADEFFEHNRLLRIFSAWHLIFLRERKVRRFQSSAEKVLKRQVLSRTWKAWSVFVKQRMREEEDRRKERRFIKDIESKRKEQLGRRAVNIIYRKRLARTFSAFKDGLALIKAKNAWCQQLTADASKKVMILALQGWQAFLDAQHLHQKVAERRRKQKLAKCFHNWLEAVEFKKGKKTFLRHCARRIQRCQSAIAFVKWITFWTNNTDKRTRLRNIAQKIGKCRLWRSFFTFLTTCETRKWRRKTLDRALKKAMGRKLKVSIEAWIYFMQIQAHKKMVSLQNYVTVIEKENERTRAECNRLARIVDSGEWDKQRISDLEHASQLLSGERDALTKLIGRLQRQHSSAVEQQQQQEDDIRNLKDQILGNNFMNRNKMLVKGASSFNSVVRAIKSDVLKKGVDPELLYSIDKMSMDQVSVFPDGEIRVKPLSKFDKGKWNSRLVYNSETTKAFAGDESDRISSSPQNSPLRRTLSHQQRGLSPTRIPREGFASSRIVHDLEI